MAAEHRGIGKADIHGVPAVGAQRKGEGRGVGFVRSPKHSALQRSRLVIHQLPAALYTFG